MKFWKSRVYSSTMKIEDKEILKHLKDIPLFATDTSFVRVNNCIVISYIAHKLRKAFFGKDPLYLLFLNTFSKVFIANTKAVASMTCFFGVAER